MIWFYFRSQAHIQSTKFLRGHINTGKDVVSGLQLAAIQVATSTILPEKGTCMTGFEMAIRQIGKCWIYSPLKDDEQNMLRSWLDFTDLPTSVNIGINILHVA
jgi:hypothetical protein